MSKKSNNNFTGQFPEFTAKNVSGSGFGNFPGASWEPIVLNGKDTKASQKRAMAQNGGMKAYELKEEKPIDAFNQIGTELGMDQAPPSMGIPQNPKSTMNRAGAIDSYLGQIKNSYNDANPVTGSTAVNQSNAKVAATGINYSMNASEAGFEVGNNPQRAVLNRASSFSAMPQGNQKPASTDIDAFQPPSAMVSPQNQGVQMAQNVNQGTSPNPADKTQLTSEGGSKVQAQPDFTNSFIAKVNNRLG